MKRKSTSQYRHSTQRKSSKLSKSCQYSHSTHARRYSSDGGPPHFAIWRRRNLLFRTSNIQKRTKAESAEKIAKPPIRTSGETKVSITVTSPHIAMARKYYFNPTLQAPRMLDQRCLLMSYCGSNVLRLERREPSCPHHSETPVKHQDSNGIKRAR